MEESPPDLKEDPWFLSSSGICGKEQIIADIGGPNNLNYMENHGVSNNLEEIVRMIGKSNSFVMGPGATSSKILGFNAELIVNTCLNADCKSVCSFVTDSGGYKQQDYKSNEIGALANVLITEGKIGKVIKVSCSCRIGKFNFVSCMKNALNDCFSEKTIGLAGVFQIKKGRIHAHVMPDFPKTDLLCKKDSDDWLKFYDMGAEPESPLVCLSVFISNDKTDLDLRLEHTHFFSKHGDAAHYHYDTTPEIIEYEGFFVPCDSLFRISVPSISKERKKFFDR